jgi:hypothetical protein
MRLPVKCVTPLRRYVFGEGRIWGAAPPSRNILARYILKIKDSQTLVKYARRSKRIMAKTQADWIFKSSGS